MTIGGSLLRLPHKRFQSGTTWGSWTNSLRQKDHLSLVAECSGVDPIQVDARTCHRSIIATAVPFDTVMTGRKVALGKRSDAPTQHVEHLDLGPARDRQVELDRGVVRQRIGPVLLERESSRSQSPRLRL